MIPLLPRSTSARFAMLTFIALTLSSIILLGFVARVTSRQLDEEAVILAHVERKAIADVVRRDGIDRAKLLIDSDLRVPGATVVLLAAADGTKVAGNIRAWPPTLDTATEWRRIELFRSGSTRAEPFGVSTAALPGGHKLLVGRSFDEEARMRDTLETTLVGAIALALALAGAVSAMLGRYIDIRIDDIAEVAGRVGDGNMSDRIPVSRENDSFDRLSATLNTMLTRIETLLREIRTVTDGLAHDLRSPLTRLKARIERAAASLDGTLDLDALSTETDQLLSMLETTLEISRAEAGLGRERFATIDLAALVRDMGDMYEPLADDRGVEIAVEAPAPLFVHVHRELVGRAVANLVDNALRYGRKGGRIELAALAADDGICLTVRDRGPGIAVADRQAALSRFGRLDSARRHGGAGLGLSLADSVARMHGGTLTLGDNDPGLLVTIRLPAPLEAAQAA